MKTMVFPPLHCTSHVNRLFTIWLFVSKKKTFTWSSKIHVRGYCICFAATVSLT
jgi:hypothetical protein